MAGEGRQAVRAVAAVATGIEDDRDRLCRQGPWLALRSRAPVGQPGLTLGPVAADPLVGGRAADLEVPGDLARRPALVDDPLGKSEPAERRQPRVSMGHESPSQGVVLRHLHTVGRDISSVDNVGGNDIED